MRTRHVVGLEHHPLPTNYSAINIRKNLNSRAVYGTSTRNRSLASVDVAAGLMLFVGSILQGYANGTLDTVFVAIFLLIVGIFVVRSIFPHKIERRTFLFTYAICIFVGGLAQIYSFIVFDAAQSTTDSLTFLSRISSHPPFTTMSNMERIDSPLAILVWQQVYKATWWLGLDFGPYIAIVFNAMVMGLTGSITVRTARDLFGNDTWRLWRVGMLFSFCGLFILFGAVLLRDCFTTLLNALVLWGIIRCLTRPSPRTLLYAAILTSVSTYAMVYLRVEAVLLFGLYWLLAFVIWFFSQKLNITRILTAIAVLLLLYATSSYFISSLRSSQELQSRGLENYAALSAVTSEEDSLGMRLVVNQPLPIRLFLGSGLLLINPIPLWASFYYGAPEYSWIKGYNGIYQVFILIPLALLGVSVIRRMYRVRSTLATPFIFLAIYLIVNMAAVAVTSLEQRHIAQFMPAVIILAALPDTRETRTRKELRNVAWGWLGIVALLHIVWAVLKG